MTKHKWHKEITAFINGENIEATNFYNDIWIVQHISNFDITNCTFRIKPKEPVYEYQVIFKRINNNNYNITDVKYKSKEDFKFYFNNSHEFIEFYLPSKQEVTE